MVLTFFLKTVFLDILSTFVSNILFLGVDSASTGGTWDISNADRLGKSEVTLVNIFIEGVAQIIKWEEALENGGDVEEQIKEAKPFVTE
jgi:protein-arginine kinase